MKFRPYRDPEEPAAAPVPRNDTLGCLAMLVPVALVIAAIVFATMHPWPGVMVAVAVLVVGIPTFAWGLRVANRNQRIANENRLERLRAIAPARGDAWRRLLAAQGFESDLAMLAPHVRPAVRMVLCRVEDGAAFDAPSREGGDPMLPPDRAWPRDASGDPMRFVLQIDLAEVAKARTDVGLPAEGTLYAFESARDFAWTVFIAPPGERVRTTSPASDRKRQSRVCEISFVAYDDPPDVYALGDAATATWDEPKYELYDSLREYLETDGGRNHKLGGHPNAVQDLAEIEGEGARRLVMQLDSDDAPGWMWGDAGRVYLVVEKEAHARGDLSKVEAVGQCG